MTVQDEGDRLLRIDQVLAMVPVSESTLYRMVKRNEFPKPVYPTKNISAWVESEVRAWNRALRQKRDNSDLV